MGRLKPKDLKLVHILLIVIIAFLAYANSFTVPFQFDDTLVIKENLLIRDLRFFTDPSQVKGTHLYYYLKVRYVSLLSFALDYQIYGLNPVGFHVTNLAIHIVNALLVYLLLLLTFATPRLKTSRLKERAPTIALVTALLFVAHPVQTQAVTYIVQRYMSLASFFYLLTLILFIKWRLISLEITPQDRKGFRRTRVGFYLFSLVAAFLGMKTKEITFTLPFAIVLYEFLFFQEKWCRRVLFMAPYFLLILVIPLGLVELVDIHKPLREILATVSTKTFIATPVSRWDYLLTEFTVMVTYLRLLLYPVDQNLDYDYPIYRSILDPEVFFSFLFVLSLFGLAGYLIYRYRDQAPAIRVIAFGILFFFLALAVESSFMPMVDVINEHRLYLPSVGAFTTFTVSAFLLADLWQNRRPLMAKSVLPVLLLVVLIFTGATYKRNQVWQSEVSLWQDILRKSPNKARAYNGLGLAYAGQKRFAEAIPLYQKAIRLNPYYSYPYLNLGVVYINLGRTDEAVALFLQAIKVYPHHSGAYNNLGEVYRRQGKLQAAEMMFQKALEIHPGNVYAQKNLQNLNKTKKSQPSDNGHIEQ